MDIIKWRDSYDTGIGAMDEEHKKIIEVINSLYRMIRGADESDDLKSIYAILAEYSKKHFINEEKLLESNDYPDMDEQRDSHSAFIGKLDEIRDDLEANRETALPEIYKYLRLWWLEHIIGTDKKYGPFLKDKGL